MTLDIRVFDMRRDQEEEGTLEQVFDGGISADHAADPHRTVRVAPTEAGEFNAVQHELTPVACVQLSDVLFEFDSSIVRPDAKAVMKSLAKLREEDQRVSPTAMRPASVFAHADPTGDDNYNKKLSGRRAQAVYGMLTRNTDLWEELYSNPLGGDDWRGAGVATMERALGKPAGSTSGAGPRAILFKEYMDLICVDDTETPFTLDSSTDFLAQGQDADGKGDYQGCSEFNPLRVFSRAEHQRFSQASNRAERNRENAPNRRVVIFLFRAGSTVKPDRWPCPRAKEGSAGCRKRFHIDGDARRNPKADRREFDTDGDTFACRFYHHRIATLSPCEKVLPQLVCCKFRGTVIENVDPEGIGRLKVNVPDVLGGDEKFAMPALPFADNAVGFCMLPPVGANVWVDFEQGDINRPVWSGCFWAEGEAPAEVRQPGLGFIKTETLSYVMNENSSQQGFGFKSVTASIEAKPERMRAESIVSKIDLETVTVSINQDGIKVI